MPEPACDECGRSVEWGDARCARCDRLARHADKTPCPSCGTPNSVSAEYCTACGTPMAVITRIMMLSRAKDREPLETWRVYGIETRVVGREREMERLKAHYQEVVQTRASRLIAVTGSTGLGKSRLLDEFCRHLNETFAEAHVLQAASRDESGAAYSMFGRLLKERFYIAEKEHPESARRKVLEAVHSIVHGRDAERLAHLVGQLLDIDFEDSPFVPTIRDSEGAQELDRRAYEALAELLRADAARDPLVLILEDLQYATNRSLDLITYLAQHVADSPILIIVSWNPEESVSDRVVVDLDVAEELELTPLSDDEVESFVRDTLRKASNVPPDLVGKITEAAHGNPLSVEEMLRILLSQGIIDTREQAWKVHEKRLASMEFPSTVEGTVQARLATLTDDERSILGMAACVGTTFWPQAVMCLARQLHEAEADDSSYWALDGIDGRTRDVLDSLERKDMIRVNESSSISGVDEMYFKHRIERAAVYDGLSAQEKQRNHRLTAQWLLRKVDAGDEGSSQSIANHFDRAGCLEHAAQWYLRTARRAAQRYANDAAVSLYVKGLSYLSDADIEAKLDAFLGLGTVWEVLGEYDQSLAYYREMLRYAWLVDARIYGGKAHNKIGQAYRALGEYDLSLTHLERALELFREEADEAGIASTLDDIGKIHWIRGEFAEAETFYSAALHLRRKLGEPRAVALSLNHMGSLKLLLGDMGAAMDRFREALELRRQSGDKQGVVDSFNNLAILCLERGQSDQALRLLEEALGLAREIGFRGSMGFVLNNLGEANLMLGNLGKARDYLAEAMSVSEDIGERRLMFDVLRNLGKLALREANRTVALERVNEALSIANQLDSPLLLGIGMQSLADLHAEYIFNDKFKDESKMLARECYRDAIAILRGVGNEGELGKALSNYGRFLVELGESDDGRERLEQAKEIFRRLEMKSQESATDRLITDLG